MILLKKSPAVSCPSSGLLSALCASTLSSITAPCFPRDSRGRRVRQHRLYASVHDAKPSQIANLNNNGQPLKWPTSANPTPYEILGLARGAPYNKSQYFQLAKHYHPDRKHHTADDGIPHLTKLERYRLVVAANEILSNPQKKRMYDLYGFGWESQTDSQTRHREADRMWRQEPGNPSMNATWEDWERWHEQRNGGEKQEQMFTSNIGFMAIVSAIVIVGTWSKMTMAGTNSMSLLDMQEQKQAAISRELQERRNQRIRMDRAGRVESFLRQREAEKWAYDPPGHGLPVPGEKKA